MKTTGAATVRERGTSEDELRRLVAAAGAVLTALGLVDYLGHTSARLPGGDRLVVKPKHSPTVRSMAGLGPDAMVVVDLDGRPTDPDAAPPPAEIFLHTEIYRSRPDVEAVVHTHQPAATRAGVLGVAIEPVLHVPSTFVDAPPPVWPHAVLVDTPSRGEQVAAALGSQRFCQLQGHGIVGVATDVREAVVGAAMLEQLAEVALAAAGAGRPPRVIPPEEIAVLRAQVAGVAGRWAYFCQLAGVGGAGDVGDAE